MSVRFLTAGIFGFAAIYVGVHNLGGESLYIFPVLAGLVGPDPQAQGRATVALLAVVAAIFLVRDLLWLRRRGD